MQYSFITQAQQETSNPHSGVQIGVYILLYLTNQWRSGHLLYFFQYSAGDNSTLDYAPLASVRRGYRYVDLIFIYLMYPYLPTYLRLSTYIT